MIIRGTALTCLVILLISVLYFPSAYTPEYFLQQVRIEHALEAELWGQKHALDVLDTTLSIHAGATVESVLPSGFIDTGPPSPIDAPLARKFNELSERVRSNQYFSSIEALLLLATYRYVALLHGLTIPLFFCVAAISDGFLRRAVKAKQFQHYNPEVFAASAAAAVLVVGVIALALVGPWTANPIIWSGAPLLIGILGRSVVANFHSRG